MELDKFLDSSEQVDVSDFDWSEARNFGLSENERFILTYFSDIENQTIVYLRDLLHTKTALDPEVIGFLSIWNYEEYFHGKALAQLLKECGFPLEERRIEKVRNLSQISEKIEAFLSTLLSKVFSEEFPAVYMAWGAIQELTTLRGYERLSKTTQNPVLKILAERIAKQERRHFAWYFNNASERLGKSIRAQRLTRFLLRHFWSPVGAGVKDSYEVSQLMKTLFSKNALRELALEIDEKIGSLPGLSKINLMNNYTMKIV